jgi:hypothetical protein
VLVKDRDDALESSGVDGTREVYAGHFRAECIAQLAHADHRPIIPLSGRSGR